MVKEINVLIHTLSDILVHVLARTKSG